MDAKTQANNQILTRDVSDPNSVSPIANQTFNTPAPSNPMTANQIANQGEALNSSNPILAQAAQQKINDQSATPDQSNTSPGYTDKKSQTQIFGKSELLDANKILSETLYITNGKRVADLGAGGGMFSLQAARLVGDQGVVYAVDIIKNTLLDIESKARMSKLYNIKAVWSNIEILGATKIPESSLDFVLLVNVLFQSDKHYEMMAEGHRLLKSEGKMLIIDWSTTAPGFTPQKNRQINQANIREHASKLKLVLEQEFQAGQYHFGMIFVKP
ncbi:class I SAM-dependent methyltransferase [Patescibacteria group bacterium]|nr:class I SAM-dependent methyltransferase [Patescibacteria group bacterium]